MPITKGGKEKDGWVDFNLKPASGVGGSLDPVQVGSVVQGLQAVVMKNRPHSCEVVGGAGEGFIGTLDRQVGAAIASKGKSKGKSLQSS